MDRRIDEFQNIYGWDLESSMDEFFDAMDISDEQKEKRKSVADKLFLIFTALFVLAESTEDIYVCVWWLSTQLTDVVQDFGKYDSYSIQYIDKFSREYVEVTFNHWDSPYYISDDRALLGALNEANAIIGYEELQDAIEDGAQYKIWKTERDNKVRPTHKVVDGKKIPIDEYFNVGGERLLFPRDEVNCENLGEISNCRCHLTFE